MSQKNEIKTETESPREMWAIIERAQTGDKTALPALRELLDRVPAIRKELGADLDRTVEYSIAKSMGGEENLAFREAMKRKLLALREELEGLIPAPRNGCWLIALCLLVAGAGS